MGVWFSSIIAFTFIIIITKIYLHIRRKKAWKL
jgi:hypothetical protein